MSSPLYALVLAGGSGERFWPLSRRAKPKQLLSLLSQDTLLESTVRRLDTLVPRENVLVLTNCEQEEAVRQLLPQLEPSQIIAEPLKRDTAAAIALGTGWIAHRDSSATMIVLPADQVIDDIAAFQATLRAAATAAESTGELVTIGIRPTWACPGYGYIEQGERIRIGGVSEQIAVHEVVRFREKPAAELAEQFIKQGNFRWNAGIFVWSIPAILSALKRHAPEFAAFVEHLHQTGDLRNALADRFPHLTRISIDYAVIEKADRVLVVEAQFDWNDVGGWAAVAEYLRSDDSRNAANVDLAVLNAANNIVYSDQKTFVALLGVQDLIVVHTADAILVCNRHETERIKALVARVPEKLR